MTWLHFTDRPNLTLIHVAPDGQIRQFLIFPIFGDVDGASNQYSVDLKSACATDTNLLASRSITIKMLTPDLGGIYALGNFGRC